MNKNTSELKSQVEIPLIAAYAGCLMEAQDVPTNAKALFDAINKLGLSKHKQYDKFVEQVQERQEMFTIPFIRNSIDQAMLIASTPVSSSQSFKVYSDVSNVSLGYLIATSSEYIYRDRPDSLIETEIKIAEALNTDQINEAIKNLKMIEESTDFVYGPDEGDAVMNFNSPSIASCFKSDNTFQKSTTGDKTKSLYIEIYILRSDEINDGKVIRRKLAVSKLDKIDEFNYSLFLPPSQTMELHAASIEGHSVLIESPALRLLFKLPDLTDSSSRSYLKIDPTYIFKELLGIYNQDKLMLDHSLALHLFKKYKWFNFSSPDDWFLANNNI